MIDRKKIGAYGEDLAADFLIKKGWKIVARNLRAGYQEMDILALKDGVFAFIEVKTRLSGNNLEGADYAITSRKIGNLKKGIRKFINRNKIDENLIRLDLIAVDISKEAKIAKIKHYIDIF